eukprot:scpid22659/ scgid7046/ TPR repeat-containing protein DDB_G0287407
MSSVASSLELAPGGQGNVNCNADSRAGLSHERRKDVIIEDAEVVQRLIDRNLESRNVRVFLSSTFRDCQAERNILQRNVVPLLQSWCASLRPEPLGFNVLDLRWGVTDEQVQGGGVVGICLDGIDQCRPFFIGILTNRYGWHNTSKLAGTGNGEDDENSLLVQTIARASSRHPWVLRYDERSVTELEIMHGALRHAQTMKKRAFFYFRDANFVPDGSAEGDPPESDLALQQLGLLKEEIEHDGFPVQAYNDLSDFAAYVERDMKSMISTEFEECSKEMNMEEYDDMEPMALSASELGRLFQEAYCRMQTRLFVECPENISVPLHYALDTQLESAEMSSPIVVTGDVGQGKSTLLAYVAQEARKKGKTVCIHFCGCDSGSVNTEAVITSIVDQARLHGIQLPGDTDMNTGSKAASFYQLLSGNITLEDPVDDGRDNSASEAVTSPEMVVILDALNLMDGGEGASQLVPNLAWLPSTVGKNVRLIVSTKPGVLLDKIVIERQWRVVRVEGMGENAKRILISKILKDLGKCIDEEKLETITHAPQTSNPLFMACLLKELCVCGTYTSIGDLLQRYLEAGNVVDLFKKVLERWERDYELNNPDKNFRKNLVRDVMMSLCLSNCGMTETELVQAHKSNRAALSLVLSSAHDSLFYNTVGVISINNFALLQACRERYLTDGETKRENGLERRVHLFLSKYFETADISLDRRAQELPFHLMKTRDDDRLLQYLTLLSTLSIHWVSGLKFRLMQFWRHLGGYDRAGKAYLKELQYKYCDELSAPLTPGPIPHDEGSLFLPDGEDGHAGDETAVVVADDDMSDDKEADLACDMDMVAEFLSQVGEYEKALPLYKQHLGIMVKHGGDCHPLAVRALLNAAQCQLKVGLVAERGNFQRAIRYCQRAMVGANACSAHDMFGIEGDDVRSRVLHTLGHLHLCVAQSMEEGPEKDVQLRDAEAQLVRSIKTCKKCSTSRNRLISYGSLILVRKESGADLERLAETAVGVLESCCKEFGEQHIETAKLHNIYADLLRELGNNTQAQCHYRLSLKITSELLGKEHAETKALKEKLARIHENLTKTPAADELRHQMPWSFDCSTTMSIDTGASARSCRSSIDEDSSATKEISKQMASPARRQSAPPVPSASATGLPNHSTDDNRKKRKHLEFLVQGIVSENVSDAEIEPESAATSRSAQSSPKAERSDLKRSDSKHNSSQGDLRKPTTIRRELSLSYAVSLPSLDSPQVVASTAASHDYPFPAMADCKPLTQSSPALDLYVNGRCRYCKKGKCGPLSRCRLLSFTQQLKNDFYSSSELT